MATFNYTSYESRITGAQRMHIASNLTTGDDHQIMFQLNFILQNIHLRGNRARVRRVPSSSRPTQVGSDQLLRNNGQFLSTILSGLRVPTEFQPPIIQMMYEKVVGMITISTADGANLVDMEVTIYTVTHVAAEEGIFSPLEIQGLPLEPATTSSIEALERIRVNDGELTSECTICMEELAGGTEATKMPCSHIYHVDCINRWLERSHCCPLCRYAMPRF